MNTEKLTRIAIVDSDKCKPKKCNQECKSNCPVVRTGKLCIEVISTSNICKISEELCIGCGICTKKCPFDAISIINLPKNLDKETTHRYGPNGFKLHRLPTLKQGTVTGLVGVNGIGKSTCLKIMAAKIVPNLGKYDNAPPWEDIVTHYRGSELQNYFQKVVEDKLKVILKPQYVDAIPKTVKGTAGDILTKKDELKQKDQLIAHLELNKFLDRTLDVLSGGELQRWAIAVVCAQEADVYMFDEPSSYLDVKQRLSVAKLIRSMCKLNNYCLVVEHDLSVLDYLSDTVCCLYGVPGAYGVVTMPFSVREGINIFLSGFIPTENLRFRNEELTFKISDNNDIVRKRHTTHTWETMTTTLAGFSLTVQAGDFSPSEIIVLLAENACGKTTFIRLLAGILKPDNGYTVPELNVSYKPQKIAPNFPGTVRQLLHTKIAGTYLHPQFNSDVMKPLKIADIMDFEVKKLSGGELQRVAITLCLGKPADIYLIDEPSAYLDSEQRLTCSKVIKRFILHSKKTAFIVEHDLIMATYLADRVIVFDGIPSIKCQAQPPESLLTGMNKFLKEMDITFRRDPTNHRPRINKQLSVKDQEQKKLGTYFYIDTDSDLLDDPLPSSSSKRTRNTKNS